MNERKRGRSHRVPNPTLPIFLKSEAPDALKTEVQACLSQLAHFGMLDEAGLLESDPMLFDRIESLSGAGLDLLRVLRGEKPLKSTYSRQHVSPQLTSQRSVQQSRVALLQALPTRWCRRWCCPRNSRGLSRGRCWSG